MKIKFGESTELSDVLMTHKLYIKSYLLTVFEVFLVVEQILEYIS